MIITQPDYTYYVQNPKASLKSVYLNAWQRATPYWSEDCPMGREEAATYYSQEFVNPTGIYEAYDVCKALFIINCIYVLVLAFLPLFMCKDRDDGPIMMLVFAAIAAVCARLCWIVTIPMVFHRLNMSYDSAATNLDILSD